jgi:hypothetical protein
MISAIQVFNVTPEAIQVFVAQSFKEKEEKSRLPSSIQRRGYM